MKMLRWTALGLALAIVFGISSGLSATAGEREDYKKRLGQIREAVGALKALGLKEDAARLHEIANGLAKRLEHGQKEREYAKHSLEVMRLGMKAMLEADKHDLAHQLEMAVHALELRLEGRRDKEALHVYEKAPRGGHLAELMGHAAHLWDEFGHEGKAKLCRELSKKIMEREKGRQPLKRDGEWEQKQRMMKRHLEIFRWAHAALREGEKRDAADIVGRAIRAHEVSLEGREDREADAVRKKSPTYGQAAECLMLAAKLWKKFENRERAGACAELGQYYANLARKHQPKERGEERRGEHRDGEHREGDRIGNLERQVKNLTNLVEELYGEIKKLQRERR